jgi:hypothetical protein
MEPTTSPAAAELLSGGGIEMTPTPSNIFELRRGEPAPAFVERRRDYAGRVRFECRKAGVPLRIGEESDVYFLVVKPLFDAVVATLLLLLLAPLLIMIALLVKLQDGGPIFFVQNRTGYLGRRFPLIKFRTMIPGAEAAKADLRHINIHKDGSPPLSAAGCAPGASTSSRTW